MGLFSMECFLSRMGGDFSNFNLINESIGKIYEGIGRISTLDFDYALEDPTELLKNFPSAEVAMQMVSLTQSSIDAQILALEKQIAELTAQKAKIIAFEAQMKLKLELPAVPSNPC